MEENSKAPSTSISSTPQVDRIGDYKFLNLSKESGKLKVGLGIALSAVTVYFLFFRGAPSQPEISTLPTKFEIPSLSGRSNSAEILSGYDKGSDLKAHRDEPKKPKAQSAPKERFLGPSLISRSERVKILPGTEIEAVLFSAANQGLVKAKLTTGKSLEKDEELFDAGSTVLGAGSPNDGRLSISFSKLITPDGMSVEIQALALDEGDHGLGIKGNFFSGKALKVAAGLGLNFLAGVSDGLEERKGEQGVEIRKNTMRDALLNASAHTSMEESNQILQDTRSNPSVPISNGKKFILLFTSEGGVKK